MESARLEVELASLSGARAVRLVDAAHAAVPEHAHGWPVLSVFLAGGYRNDCALGPAVIDRPSAVFYRAGEAHANRVAGLGLEQIDLEFDPRWLGLSLPAAVPPVRRWIGGPTAPAARALAALWASGAPEARLAQATRRFLQAAFAAPEPAAPSWLARASAALSAPEPLATPVLARELGLNPAWMAQAYRAVAGEGLRDTVRRRRVERAVRLLREPGARACDVAQEAGFCDQSHMVRAFRHVLGRTPGAVRGDFAAAA
jgi:AraC family transcriptional regulator